MIQLDGSGVKQWQTGCGNSEYGLHVYLYAGAGQELIMGWTCQSSRSKEEVERQSEAVAGWDLAVQPEQTRSQAKRKSSAEVR